MSIERQSTELFRFKHRPQCTGAVVSTGLICGSGYEKRCPICELIFTVSAEQEIDKEDKDNQ